ncbi:MAG: amidohydrolase [Caulobacteraceae bacterium]|nr:amidohydrolase [Caulobacteraceae bacterium]
MSQDKKRGLSRRSLFSLTGGAALAPLAAAIPQAPAGAQPAVQGTHVTVSRGTNIAPAVSPDGKTVAFDLYGVLWLLDIGGGPARRLTDDFGDVAMPDWSPDGQTLVFQSYRSGGFQLWTVRRDGAGLKQLTSGPFDCREPRFAPDGKRIAFSSDRTGSYGLHVLDLATGAISTLADTASEEYEPAWSPDGTSIAFVSDKTKVEVVELASGGRRTVAAIAGPGSDPLAQSEVRSPAFTADGKGVVYTLISPGVTTLMLDGKPMVAGQDVFPFRVTWLSADEFVYAADGEIRRKRLGGGAHRAIAFSATVPVSKPVYARRRTRYDDFTPKPVIGIGSPALSPDGKTVAFRALNDIWLMPLGGRPQPVTKDTFHKSDPAFSPDGRWLSYSTDRGGKLDIWLRELATGQERQLTHLPDAAVSGSWSRDGSLIAFLDQNGAVYTVQVDTGAVQKIHGPLWEPGRPTFSPDGKVVALAAFKPYSGRYREGLSEILTIDRTTGEAAYAPVAEHRSIGTRGDDGPHWSPDGKSIAYVLGSLLWTAPVDVRGRITGKPTKLNDEVTDSPSWSGDSASLLYLSNGKLKLIAAKGGAPLTIPVPLTWTQAKPPGRTVIRLGGLWAGRGPEVLRDVDVVIEGGKIAAVAPHGGKAPPTGVKFVDASRLFAIPGLIDIHNHRQMQGYSYGDRCGRLWLSFGVTTTRSPGSPAYHGVEEREAIGAGLRIGPRYFTTGEAIDGSRIYYNFMRPVTEEGQLELELQRADALGYDMMKSYVRAPLQQQKFVAEWGHKRGIPTTSHYHYPALNFGLDQMEHLGATSRFGYSRTLSPAGAGYEDVISLFAHAGARRTPTLFQAAPMLADDPDLADDPRILALYPSWERAKLIGRTNAAKASDTAAQAVLKLCVEQIRDMLRSGGKVTAGTDSPIDLNCISLHMNLRGMVKYGVSPYEALLTATRFNGEFLEAPLGVLEPGAMADIAIVEGDPLHRIEDAAKVRMTVLGGVVHTVEELVAPFAATARAGQDHPHSPMLPPVKMARANDRFWWHDADYVESGRHACCADVFSLGAFRKAPAGRRQFHATAVT